MRSREDVLFRLAAAAIAVDVADDVRAAYRPSATAGDDAVEAHAAIAAVGLAATLYPQLAAVDAAVPRSLGDVRLLLDGGRRA